MSNGDYLERFKGHINVLAHLGGKIENKKDWVARIDKEKGVTTAEAETIASDKFIGAAFLLKADRWQYGSLINDVKNDHMRGMPHFM